MGMAQDQKTASAGRPNLLGEFRTAHNEMLGMCDMLESIADSLPHLDPKACASAAALLEPLVTRVHKFEEESVFPAFAGAAPSAALDKTIARLKAEHCEDECYAEELSDALNKVSRSAESVSPETLGYMLRGFFEAMRRHIAFEREQFMPRADLN